MNTGISLDQWRALLAVIDAGGYARAAEALGKSQSAVSYAIGGLERQLGVKVFELQGRRAVATGPGQVLYRRARALLEEAAALERTASRLGAGVEPEVRLALDLLLPSPLVLQCLDHFAGEFEETRVELIETVLSGTEDALLQRQVDLAITSRVPPGFLGIPLLQMPMIAVSHPDHPLQQLGREVTLEDLHGQRQLVVRDSGLHRRHDAGWLGAEQRWTVSHMLTSLQAVRMGLGFAWLPLAYIETDLRSGALVRLPLREGGERAVETYLVFADRDGAGPATRRLAAILQATLPGHCNAADDGRQEPATDAI